MKMIKQALLSLLAVSVCWAQLANAETSQSGIAEPAVAQLFVRGEAQLMVPPDQVSVSLGVTTESSTAKKSVAENTRKMNSLINELANLGLSDSDYKTQNFQVQPVWSNRPKGAGGSWKAKIIAYRVTNTLYVTTLQLDIIGDIIGASTEAGANQINSINFSLFNARQYRQQAITQAMENARADADVLVAASGDRIKRTLSLHLDNASASKERVQMKIMARTSMALSQDTYAPPPISAGDITVRASVSVTYELDSL
jgi:uncharacterized protein YggE